MPTKRQRVNRQAYQRHPADDGIIDRIAIDLALTGKRPEVAERLTQAEVDEAIRVGLSPYTAQGFWRPPLGRNTIAVFLGISGTRVRNVVERIASEQAETETQRERQPIAA